MKSVVDAAVAFKWLMPEIDSDKALRLLDEYQKSGHELLAPDVFPIELTHALTRAERRSRITPPWAADCFSIC